MNLLQLINNNEKENQKENNIFSNVSSLNNKEFDYSFSLSKKINSTKINSILENHKNLKILKAHEDGKEKNK